MAVAILLFYWLATAFFLARRVLIYFRQTHTRIDSDDQGFAVFVGVCAGWMYVPFWLLYWLLYKVFILIGRAIAMTLG